MKINTLSLLLVTLAAVSSVSHARRGRDRIYDLTCGIKNGNGVLEATSTARVAGAPQTLRGQADFGTYVVNVQRKHVFATVTESETNLSNQFMGEIEIHGGSSFDDSSVHSPSHFHGTSGFQISVTPAVASALPVTLVCSALPVVTLQ